MKTVNPATPIANQPPPIDAIALLEADHKALDELFAQFESAPSAARKQALVAEICTALKVHMQIEEEIFYPALRPALEDKLLIPEAIVEHSSLKGLIATLERVLPDGEMYDARVKVLSEYVKHHVKEEQSEMFAKVKASSLDTVELGARLAARKEDLMAQAA
jgi:hypothetical protein